MLSKSSSYLNLEGFIEFLLQLAYFMFTDVTSKPSEFVPLLFSRMREASYASSKPLFQTQFEELTQQDDVKQSDYGDAFDRFNDTDELTQVLKDLTHEVNTDPNYVLPRGFSKVRADKIREAYEPDKKKYPRESQQISVKILDDLLGELFDIHVVEPVIKYDKFFVVKPQS